MTIKRRFIFGEDWLYIKIYSGPKILEDILINDIYPIVHFLYSSNIIDKFFFIRYFDEGYHLRLRFKLTDPKMFTTILNVLSEKLRLYSDKRIISKIIIDTYKREIERYGALSMESAETIFSIDSWEILNLLTQESDYRNRWVYSIKLMDTLLNKFRLSNREKYELYQGSYLIWESEFGKTKEIKDTLGKIYREVSDHIEKVLTDNYPFINPDENVLKTLSSEDAVWKVLELRKNNSLEVPFYLFLGSLMHMHYNRIFRTKQRKHEFVIYYIMSCFYKSLISRKEH